MLLRLWVRYPGYHCHLRPHPYSSFSVSSIAQSMQISISGYRFLYLTFGYPCFFHQSSYGSSTSCGVVYIPHTLQGTSSSSSLLNGQYTLLILNPFLLSSCCPECRHNLYRSHPAVTIRAVRVFRLIPDTVAERTP